MIGASPSGYISGETHQSPRPVRVVATRSEPSVVEHEPLDPRPQPPPSASARRRVRVVIEVHGLPRVQQHLARRGRMPGPRPQRSMEAPAGRCQAVGRNEPPRPRASSTTRQARGPPRRDAAARPAARIRRPSGSRSASTRWLPLQARCAPHTSPCHSPNPTLAREQQRHVLVRRAAAPVLGEHGAARPRPAIRLQLAGVHARGTSAPRPRARAAAA